MNKYQWNWYIRVEVVLMVKILKPTHYIMILIFMNNNIAIVIYTDLQIMKG